MFLSGTGVCQREGWAALPPTPTAMDGLMPARARMPISAGPLRPPQAPEGLAPKTRLVRFAELASDSWAVCIRLRRMGLGLGRRGGYHDERNEDCLNDESFSIYCLMGLLPIRQGPLQVGKLTKWI